MQPIRLLLAYAGVEYEDKRYNVGPAPDYDRSEWLNDKFNLGLDFPNVSNFTTLCNDEHDEC
jgi:glutathione S-transferase